MVPLSKVTMCPQFLTASAASVECQPTHRRGVDDSPRRGVSGLGLIAYGTHSLIARVYY